MSEITHLLNAIGGGDAQAVDRLMTLVYQELRRLAAQKMAAEASSNTLQPTALVHEAWLKLGGAEKLRFENKAHFFCAAAEAMRRILIDRARQRLAAKRGGGAERIDLGEIELASPLVDDDKLLHLNECLEQFASLHPRKAELLKLRYFVGMTFEECAASLGIALPTAKQWWAYSKAWLRVAMNGPVAPLPEPER